MEAFAEGACGEVYTKPATVLEPGAAAFYGVVGIEHLVRLAIAERRDWYYGDNAFFDCARGRYFRFARNAVQLAHTAPPDHERYRALGLEVKPWKRYGEHIVVVEQSEHFLGLVGARHWLLRVLDEIVQHTDRPLRIRRWRRDKEKAAALLQGDLEGAWALVTHMSAAANEALLAGVPVFVSGLCAASPMASGELSEIEKPRYPDGREEWAAGLAGQQWTLDEIKSGIAWRALNA
ncbi:MAG: hypothetical protein U1A72_15560 [Sulfuritalea sp.]|nr:hypothetical protein [Sulfuritalea sp.]